MSLATTVASNGQREREESVEDELVKEIADRVERTLTERVFTEPQEHNLVVGVVDEYVEKELKTQMLNAKPLTKVGPVLTRQAEARHAALLDKVVKERARRLDELEIGPEGL